jgi:hypothetical protein
VIGLLIDAKGDSTLESGIVFPFKEEQAVPEGFVEGTAVGEVAVRASAGRLA